MITEEISHGGCLGRLPARSLTGRPPPLTAVSVKPCPAPPRPGLPGMLDRHWPGREVSPSPLVGFSSALCSTQHSRNSQQPGKKETRSNPQLSTHM